MSWGSFTRVYRQSYASCAALLNSARNREDGRPLNAGLRVFDRGTHYAVQCHSTDIVRYYPDGAIEICTSYTQRCTIDKIEQLVGVAIINKALPLYNSRKPDPTRTLTVAGSVFNGVGGYLRIGPDGRLDPASVAPIEVDVVKDLTLVRGLKKKSGGD